MTDINCPWPGMAVLNLKASCRQVSRRALGIRWRWEYHCQQGIQPANMAVVLLVCMSSPIGVKDRTFARLPRQVIVFRNDAEYVLMMTPAFLSGRLVGRSEPTQARRLRRFHFLALRLPKRVSLTSELLSKFRARSEKHQQLVNATEMHLAELLNRRHGNFFVACRSDVYRACRINQAPLNFQFQCGINKSTTKELIPESRP